MNYDNGKTHIHPKSSPVFSAYHLTYNILLQTGTQMHCKCVPICNNLLQLGMQVHCKCVPICNNLLQIGTLLQIATQKNSGVSLQGCAFKKNIHAIYVIYAPRRHVNPFRAGTDFRRQNLTSKFNPRTERIKNV